MDPDQVDSDFPIRDSHVRVSGFRAYLSRALRDTLRPYFSNVQIVSALPRDLSEPYVTADVRLDLVEARNHRVGNLEYRVLRMQWAMAFRPSDSDDYVFTFRRRGPE